jgi:hypothetical protein
MQLAIIGHFSIAVAEYALNVIAMYEFLGHLGKVLLCVFQFAAFSNGCKSTCEEKRAK